MLHHLNSLQQQQLQHEEESSLHSHLHIRCCESFQNGKLQLDTVGSLAILPYLKMKQLQQQMHHHQKKQQQLLQHVSCSICGIHSLHSGGSPAGGDLCRLQTFSRAFA